MKNQEHLTALATIVVGFVSGAMELLLSTWRENEDQVRSTFAAVQNVIEGVLDFVLTNLIRPTLAAINKVWNTHNDEILASAVATFAFLQEQFQGFVDMVMRLWEAWGDDILTVARITYRAIAAVIGAALDVILTTIRVVLALIRGDWEAAWNAIGGLLERILGGILDFVVEYGAEFLTAFVTLVANVAAFIAKRGAELLWDAFNEVIDGIVALFEGFYEWLIGGSFIPNLFGDVAGWVKSTGVSLVKDAFGKVVSSIENVLGSINLSSVKSALGSVISKAQQAINKVKNAAGGGGGDGGGGGGSGGGGGGGDQGTFRDPSHTTTSSTPTSNARLMQKLGGGSGVKMFAEGGFITKTGLAMVHAGERILPPADGQVGAPAGTTINLNGDIVTSGRREGQEAGRALVRELRSAGFRG